MDILPPLVARRVKRLKSLHMERERVMEKYLEEIAALEMKYLDLCKPLYKKIGNVVAGRLGDEIDRVNKEGGGEKEEEGSNGDNSGIKKMLGRERRGRGPHPWRANPTTTRSTESLPLDRVLLLLPPKTTPRETMTKRGAWWEYLSSGYTQWDTWRPYPNQ